MAEAAESTRGGGLDAGQQQQQQQQEEEEDRGESVERRASDRADDELEQQEEEDTAVRRRRKKATRASQLEQGGVAVGGRRVAKRALTRSMAEWEATCRDLRLPRDCQQFTDFVLVFDLDGNMSAPSGSAGCCSCCQPSPKELQQALDVRTVYAAHPPPCFALPFFFFFLSFLSARRDVIVGDAVMMSLLLQLLLSAVAEGSAEMHRRTCHMICIRSICTTRGRLEL